MRLAKADGVSLHQWIASAVAQQVGAVETAALFRQLRAGIASGDGLAKLLEKVADVTPDAKDALPERVRARRPD
jgi:hypothetical protein